MVDALLAGPDGHPRCFWHGGYADYLVYHDDEWGRPVADDRRLFEKICLEGFQSGLSWLTILRKREAFRAAFANFDIDRVARFGTDDVARLMGNAGIVRHRGKIEAAIANAQCCAALVAEHGSIAAFLWAHEPAPLPAPRTRADLAARAVRPEAKAASATLKRAGWRFVGPTTVTALFQAAGLVNDHVAGCIGREPCEAARAAFRRPTRG